MKAQENKGGGRYKNRIWESENKGDLENLGGNRERGGREKKENNRKYRDRERKERDKSREAIRRNKI